MLLLGQDKLKTDLTLLLEVMVDHSGEKEVLVDTGRTPWISVARAAASSSMCCVIASAHLQQKTIR